MISGELTILKRTLGPIQGLISLLREHSDDKNLISPLAKTYFMDVSVSLNIFMILFVFLCDMIPNVIFFDG
jgi:hypothetical protein